MRRKPISAVHPGNTASQCARHRVGEVAVSGVAEPLGYHQRRLDACIRGEAADILGKGFKYPAGAGVPLVRNSRSEPAENRFNALLPAKLVAFHNPTTHSQQ